MTIHLETEIVGSAYDPIKRVHSYTIERAGKRWTVQIGADEFARTGPLLGAQAATNKHRRRSYVATRLANAMQGPHDGA